MAASLGLVLSPCYITVYNGKTGMGAFASHQTVDTLLLSRSLHYGLASLDPPQLRLCYTGVRLDLCRSALVLQL